jgi:hypothetical protein
MDGLPGPWADDVVGGSVRDICRGGSHGYGVAAREAQSKNVNLCFSLFYLAAPSSVAASTDNLGLAMVFREPDDAGWPKRRVNGFELNVVWIGFGALGNLNPSIDDKPAKTS